MHLNMYYTAPLRNAVASHSPVETKLSFHRAPQLSGEEFLLFLGSPVRDLRNRRGMTRKTPSKTLRKRKRSSASANAYPAIASQKPPTDSCATSARNKICASAASR